MSNTNDLYNYLNPSDNSDKEIDEFLKRAIKAPSSTPYLPTGVEGESRIYEIPENVKNFEGYVDLTKTNLGDWNNVLEQRAKNQSSWEVAGNAAKRFGATTLTKFGQGVGFIGGFLDWASGGFGIDNISKMTDNGVSKMFEGLENWAKEQLPIYHTKAYTEGNVLQKMGTLGFWADDAVDGFAFMASAMLPGGILKGIGTGTKFGVKGLQLGSKISEGVEGLFNTAKQEGKIFTNLVTRGAAGDKALEGSKVYNWVKNAFGANNIDRNLITTWNTIAESAMEARDAKRQTFEQLVKQTGKTEDELTPQEKQDLNLRASKVALNTFGANLFIVGLSEHFMNKMWGTLKPEEKAIQKESKNILEPVLTPSIKDYGKMIKRNVLSNMLREGVWEENSQLAVSDFFRESELGKDNRDFVSGSFGNMIKNFTTDEGQQNIILGAITGILPGVYHGYHQVKADNKFSKSMRDNLVYHFNNIKQGITYAYEKDEQGKPILAKPEDIYQIDGIKLNPTKLDELHKGLADWFEKTGIVAQIDPKGVGSQIRDLLDSKAMYYYLNQDGGLDVLKGHVKLATEQNLRDAEKNGILTPEYEKEQRELADNRIAQAEKFNALNKHLQQGRITNIDLGKENDEVRSFREVMLMKQYDKLTDVLAYRQSSNKQGEDTYHNYDGSQVQEQKKIQSTINLINQDKLSEIDDKYLQQIGITKQALTNLPSNEIISVKEKLLNSLNKQNDNLNKSVEKDRTSLKDANKEYERLTSEKGIKEEFELYKKSKVEHEVKEKEIKDTIKKDRESYKSNTAFDILGNDLFNTEDNTNTLYGKFVDESNIHPDHKEKHKKEYRVKEDFTDSLKNAEQVINDNIEKFYNKDGEIDNNAVQQYAAEANILKSLSPENAVKVINQVLQEDKSIENKQQVLDKNNKVLNTLGKDGEELFPLSDDIKDIKDKDKVTLSEQESTRLENTEKSIIDNLGVNRIKVVNNTNLNDVKYFETTDNITDLVKEFDRLGLKDYSYFRVENSSIEALENNLKQYIEHIPESITKLFTQLKKQLEDLKRVQSKGKITKLIANNLKRIDESLAKLNKELEKLTSENTNVKSSVLYSVLERGNRIGAGVHEKVSYMPFAEGEYQDKIPGHDYSGEVLDNYAKILDEKVCEFHVRPDSNQSYSQDNAAEKYINNEFAKGKGLKQILVELRKNVFLLGELKTAMNSLDYTDVDDIGQQELAMYDLVNIKLVDEDKTRNPDTIELWIHKPRVLIYEREKLNKELKDVEDEQEIKRGENILESTDESLDNLRERRKILINNIRNNPIIKIDRKIGGRIFVGNTKVGYDKFAGQLSGKIEGIYIKTESGKFEGIDGKVLDTKISDSFNDYTSNGNVIVAVKDGDNIRLILLNVDNIGEETIPLILQILQHKVNNEPHTQEITVDGHINGKSIKLTGQLGDVFDTFLKWNPYVRLDRDGNVVRELSDNKTPYRFELGNKEGKYGILFGKDGFISKDAINDLTNPIYKDQLNNFTKWLQTTKRYNIDKSKLGKISNVLLNKQKLDYNNFITNFLSTKVQVSGKGKSASVSSFPTLILDYDGIKYEKTLEVVSKYEDVLDKELTFEEFVNKTGVDNKALVNVLKQTIKSVQDKTGKEIKIVIKRMDDYGFITDNTITLSTNTLENHTSSSILSTIAHEILHAYINNNITSKQRIELAQEFSNILTAVVKNSILDDNTVNSLLINWITRSRELPKSDPTNKDRLTIENEIAEYVRKTVNKNNFTEYKIKSIAKTLVILCNQTDVTDELITYTSTNPIFAKFLQSINVETTNEKGVTVSKSLYARIMELIHNIVDAIIPKSSFTKIYDILAENEIENKEKISVQFVTEKVDTKSIVKETELEKIDREEQLKKINKDLEKELDRNEVFGIDNRIYLPNNEITVYDKEGNKHILDGRVVESGAGMGVKTKWIYDGKLGDRLKGNIPDLYYKPIQEIQQKYQQKRDELNKEVPVQEETISISEDVKKDINNDAEQFIEQIVDGTIITSKESLTQEDLKVAADGIFAWLVDEQHIGLKGETIEIPFKKDTKTQGSVLSKLNKVIELQKEVNPVWAANLKLLTENIDELETIFKAQLNKYKLRFDENREVKDEDRSKSDTKDEESTNMAGIQEHIRKPYENDYRDSANGNIRFLVDKLADVENKLDSNGKVVYKRDKTFGFKKLADSNTTWKTLMQNLHDASNTDDIFGKYDNYGELIQEGKLAKLVKRFPVFKEFADKFKIEWKDGKIVKTGVPKERYVQLFNVFEKWEHIFYKTSINNTDKGIFYKSLNQTKMETQTSIMEQWTNSFINSDLFDYTDNKYNKVEFGKVKAKFDELYKDLISNSDFQNTYPGETRADIDTRSKKYNTNIEFEKAKQTILDIVNKLGIKIDMPTIEFIIEKITNSSNSGMIKLNALIGSKGLGLNYMINNIDKVVKGTSKVNENNLEKNNHISDINKGDIKRIVNFFIQQHPEFIETNISSVEDADYHTMTLHHHITRIVQDLKNGNFSYLDVLKSMPQFSNSRWIKQIDENRNNKEFIEKLNVITFNYMKNENTGDIGKQYTDLSQLEQSVQVMTDLMSVIKDKDNKAIFTPMTFSSRTSWYKLTGFEPIDIVLSINNKGNFEILDNTRDTFIGYLQDELNRIEQVQKQVSGDLPESDWIEKFHYYTSAKEAIERWGKLGIKILETDLEWNESKTKVVGYNKGNKVIPIGMGAELRLFPGLQEYLSPTDTGTFEVKTDLNKYIDNILHSRINDIIKRFTELGIISKLSNGLYKNSLIDGNLLEKHKDYYKVNDTGLTEEQKILVNNSITSKAIQNIITNVAVNHISSGIEFEKLLGIEPSIWKSRGDETKRSSVWSSTKETQDDSTLLDKMYEGQVTNNKSEKGERVYNVAIIKDIKRPSSVFNDIFKIYKEQYKKENPTINDKDVDKIVASILKPFGANNVTDGQTWANPYKMMDMMIRTGRWSDNHQEVFDYLEMKGKWNKPINEIPISDLERISELAHTIQFNPMKTLYLGYKELKGKNSNILAQVVMKHSEATLFKRFVQDKESQELYDRMTGTGIYQGMNSIDMISAESVFKGALPNNISLYQKGEDLIHDNNGESKVIQTQITDLKNIYTFPLLAKNMGVQLEVPIHKAEFTKLGTQAKKIVMSNIEYNTEYTLGGVTITGKELLPHLNNVLSMLSNKGLDDVIKELEYNPKTGKINEQKVLDKIVDNLKRNQVGEEFINAVKSGIMLDAFGGLRNKIVQSLNKYIQDRTVDIKLNGAPLVQVSSMGVYKGLKGLSELGVKNYKEYSDKVGKLQINFNTDGSLKSYDTIVNIGIFRTLIPDYSKNTFEQNKEWLMKNKEVLELLAHRIPTQGDASIVIAQVVDVVPDGSGDIIILPDEITTSTGSDFDIDKLFVFKYNYKEENGELSKIDYDADSRERYIRYVNEKIGKEVITDKFDEETEKGLVKRDKVISYKEFQKLPLEQQQTKESLQNRLIDVFKSILQNKAHTLETLTPLDNNDLKDHSNKIGVLTGNTRDLDDLEFYGLDNTIKIKQNLLGGKSNVGSAALNRVDIPIAQQLGYTIKGISKIGGKLGIIIDNGKVIPIGRLKDQVENDNYYDLSLRDTNFKDNDGVLVADRFNRLLSAFVDIEKDDYITNLNMSDYVINIASLMYRLGMGNYTEVYTAQPFMKMLDEWKSNYDNELVKKPSYQEFQWSDEINGYKNKFNPLGKDFDFYIKTEKYFRDILAANTIEDIVNGKTKNAGVSNKHETQTFDEYRWSPAHYNMDSLAFTYKPLEDRMYGTNEMYEFMRIQRWLNNPTKDNLIHADNFKDGSKFVEKEVTLEMLQNYAMKQLDMLYHYKLLEKVANKLRGVTLAGRADTGSIGNNIYSIEAQTNKINELKDSNDVREFKYKIEPYDSTNPEKDSMFIGTNLDNHIGTLTDILSGQMLWYNNDYKNSIVNTMYRMLPTGTNTSEEKIKKIGNELYASIGIDYILNTYMKDNGITTENKNSYAKGLFLGKDTLSKQLTKLKATVDTLDISGDTKDFIKHHLREQPSKNSRELPEFIKATSKLDESGKTKYRTAWVTLINSSIPEVSKFGKDLLSYTFLTTGTNNSRFGISDIIPYNYLIEHGYKDHWDSYTNPDNVDTMSMIYDVILNNFKNKDIAPRVNPRNIDTYIIKNDKGQTFEILDFFRKNYKGVKQEVSNENFKKYYKAKTNSGETSILIGEVGNNRKIYLPFITNEVPILDQYGMPTEKTEVKLYALYNKGDIDYNQPPIYIRVKTKGYYEKGFGIKEYGGIELNLNKSINSANLIKSKSVNKIVELNTVGRLKSEMSLNEVLKAEEEVINESVNSVQEQNIYNQLGNKTQSENVQIVSWGKLKEAKESILPNYIISTRMQGTNKHFGNLYSHDLQGKTQGLIKTETIKEAVEKYIDWIINSQDERASWIREQLKSGELKGLSILYYKELNEPSHATALDYLINKYDWNNIQEQVQQNKPIIEEKKKTTYLDRVNNIDKISKIFNAVIELNNSESHRYKDLSVFKGFIVTFSIVSKDEITIYIKSIKKEDNNYRIISRGAEGSKAGQYNFLVDENGDVLSVTSQKGKTFTGDTGANIIYDVFKEDMYTAQAIDNHLDYTNNKQNIEQLSSIEQKDNNLGKIVDFMKELTTEQRNTFRKLRDLGKFDIDCK